MALCAEGCLPLRATPPAKRQAPCSSRASGLHALENFSLLNRRGLFSNGVIIIIIIIIIMDG